MSKEALWLCEEKYGGRLTEENEKAFALDLQRLKQGEPLAYVIGHVPFLHTKIYLDSHPLIPRAETEFWVERVLGDMKSESRPLRVLDLCAGSGCIGVAVLAACPRAHVDFVESEVRHIPTIQKNVRENGIAGDRAHYIVSDLFTEVSGSYDVILSNPPYIDPATDRTEQSVRAFEPHIALYGGKDGMSLIKKIIVGASAHLTPTGVLYIEHEPEQVRLILALAKKTGFIAQTLNDQYETPRYTRLTRTEGKAVSQ